MKAKIRCAFREWSLEYHDKNGIRKIAMLHAKDEESARITAAFILDCDKDDIEVDQANK